MQEWTFETAASTKNKHSPHKSLKMLTKISSYDRLINVRRSQCSSVFVFASLCVCVVCDSRRCAGSLAGSSSIRLAGLAAGAWTGEEVEFGSGFAEGLKELLSCYE